MVIFVGIIVGVVAAFIVVPSVDRSALREAAQQAADQPAGVIGALAAFGIAFVLRAIAWQRVLPELPFGQALAAIHLSLGANHVLPFRLGEPLRVISVVRRHRVGIEAATVSTITLRSADMLAVVGLGVLVAPTAFFGLVGIAGWLLLGVVFVSFLTSLWRRRTSASLKWL